MLSSFGLFLLLAFTGAYFAFRSEYRRKEAEGLIHPFYRTGGGVPPMLYGAAGLIAGAKLAYWLQMRGMYIGSTQDFLFSFRGNWIGGLIGGILAWIIARRLSAPAQPEELTHPHQLMDILLLWCGTFGFAGAVVFAEFERPTLSYLFRFNGLNYYGALIAGTLTYLYINKRYGIRPSIAADIGSPGMMLAYAIGRIGCHTSGDGDWGIVNEKPRPNWLSWLPDWVWAYRYPHNSIHQGKYIPGCTGNNCTELIAPAYPTPIYEAAICFLLFLTLWSLRRPLKKPGLLFAFFAILNGAERFLIEFIRATPRYSLGNWDLSQAQVLAAGWVLTGLLTLVFIPK